MSRDRSMRRPSFWFRIACVSLELAWAAFASMPGFAAPQASPAAPQDGIMLTAVSRDDSVLIGGISTGIRTPQGIASVEQIAWITPSGLWQDLPCNYHWVTDADIARCRDFAAGYLGQFHNYTIVSPDGFGGSVQAAPAHLDDCYSFATRGIYSGQPLERTAIAASDPSAFLPSHPIQPVDALDYQKTLAAFAAASPVPLGTLAGIRLYRTQWNGHSLILVERSFTDFSSANPSVVPNVKLIFAIGEITRGKFHVLFWKRNTQDENEQVLGAVTLKNGREFLITSVNSPEAQFFRVYAMRNGHIEMVFSGGGSSC
ncbi:MAG: hypothetical protein ACP5M4_05185 [Acidobacteriaceae bacterium]